MRAPRMILAVFALLAVLAITFGFAAETVDIPEFPVEAICDRGNWERDKDNWEREKKELEKKSKGGR